MIESLFSPLVVTVVATPEMWDAPLHPAEETCVRRAVPARRREFSAGRRCAREALASVGVHEFPLLSDPERIPIWPPGFVGSITHCEGYCAAALAPGHAIAALGIDAEVAVALEPELIAIVCSEAEREHVREIERRGMDIASKVMFSAKESVYKCVYPLTRIPLRFEDVEIALDWDSGGFAVEFSCDIDDLKQLPARLSGRFATDAHYICTGVTLTRPR